MVCGIQRQVQKKLADIMFLHSKVQLDKTILDAEMKQLHSNGLGMKNKKAEPNSLEEEELLWQSGVLGEKDPWTLLNIVFYFIGVKFALIVDKNTND